MSEDRFAEDYKEGEKPKISPEMRERLRAAFPAEAYKKHPTKTFLTTLKAAYVMERLNDVFGLGRWTINHKVVSFEKGYVLMSGRLDFLDYDCIVPIQFGGHVTEGTGTELADGYKSAITDILSKSASYLEIGLEMFKGNINPGGNQQSGNQPTQQNKQKAQSITDITKFLEVWEGGKIYGSFVYYNQKKYSATPEQIEQIKKSSKFKES